MKRNVSDMIYKTSLCKQGNSLSRNEETIVVKTISLKQFFIIRLCAAPESRTQVLIVINMLTSEVRGQFKGHYLSKSQSWNLKLLEKVQECLFASAINAN